MKKATNPLALDLRAGGFEVFPIAKLFDLPSNVWYPSILIRENMLAEPFAAWAANVFYTLGGVQVLQWTDAAFFYAPSANWLRPDHFVQRLTPPKVQAIISRVIRNAESANADPSRDFIIESLGIFGSVLADATSPGDVDVVFTARWRSNNRPMPEASYYPFDVSEPTNRVSRALSRGSRRMDLSSHYLLELNALALPIESSGPEMKVASIAHSSPQRSGVPKNTSAPMNCPTRTPLLTPSGHDACHFHHCSRPKLPLYRGPPARCRIPSGLPFRTTNIQSRILHTAFASHVAN